MVRERSAVQSRSVAPDTPILRFFVCVTSLSRYNKPVKKIKPSKFSKTLKIAGIVLGAFIVLIVLATLARPIIDTVERSVKSLPGIETRDFGYPEMAMHDSAMMERGVAPADAVFPPPDGTIGDTAEDYEVTEYNVDIETRDKEETCGIIFDLKPLDYVIFENATEHDRGCNFTLKVKIANVEEVLEIMEELSPKDLRKTTYTIQRTIEHLLDEREVLEKKRESIEKTLEDALNAYEEIERFAADTRDADALARVIDSKIQTVERLTRERININEQLNRLAQQEARQMDRLEYTYFYVNVTESKFIDGKEIRESWKDSVKKLVSDFNRTIQGLSLGLVTLILFTVQYAIYLLILVVVAKLLWSLTKRIWKK